MPDRAGGTFDLYGELPDGRVAIEASAGTGKTFTLSVLATRFLAERRITPSDLLIVTFTRAATAELRSRIRGQMIDAAAALAGRAPQRGDGELYGHLASSHVAERRERLELAVSDFDAASISTIHGFATQVRRSLGLTPAIDPDARLVASPDELIRTACADALAAASTRDVPAADFPSLATVQQAVGKKLGGPDLVLVPDGTDLSVDPPFLLIRALVDDALDRLEVRRTGEGTIGFDDVLTQLRAALASPEAAAVVAALRSRYKVVLIDEFQDTDRVQWDIFSSLFGHPGSRSTLVLVGDPKQAIYRFRGADISVYLEAVRGDAVRARSTLTTDWRADGAYLQALHTLLDGATFGDPSIGYVPVVPAAVNKELRMVGPDDRPLSGLDLRLAIGPGLPRVDGKVATDDVVRMIGRDLAAYVRALLDHARIPRGAGTRDLRPLQPSDVAVLVTGWEQAHDLQAALRREGIPAVVAGSGSVLTSEAAVQLRYLLHAMERPGDPRRVRVFALSWFVGRAVEEVAAADEDALSELQERLVVWAGRLADHPVAEVLGQIWAQTDVVARVLRRPDGDRNVTDLDHLAELLHLGAPHGRAGVAGLLASLDTPPGGDADADSDNDAAARRIESEAAAVQITTVWKAKGLEFPVVCLPMLWRKAGNRSALVFTDPETNVRMLDVTRNGRWPDKKALQARQDIATTEETAERLRILYVALTRSRHHTAVWWARTTSSRSNALSRLLFARGPDGTIVPSDLDPHRPKDCTITIPGDDAIPAALAPLVTASDGTIRVSVVPVRPGPVDPWSDPSADEAAAALELAPFDRHLDRSVARWSFTAITHHAGADLTDPYDPNGADGGAGDEAGAGGPAGGVDPAGEVPTTVVDGGPVAPFSLLGAGTVFGTFVHSVLEVVDFAGPDLEEALRAAVHDQAIRVGMDLTSLAPTGSDAATLLVDGLQRTIRTPLGPLFGGSALVDLHRSERLDELSFDLRLGTGRRRPRVRDIGRLVSAHLPAGAPLAPWADALAHGAIDLELGGFLTGSIDLVARVHAVDGPDGYVVADYKTNRLTRRGARPGDDDYAQGRLLDAMVEHHYPLQALLYAVALHRYLRWRLGAAEEGTHVRGAAYLFVRGMTGRDVPVIDGRPHGVVTWELPAELIVGLSDLLARGSAPGARP